MTTGKNILYNTTVSGFMATRPVSGFTLGTTSFLVRGLPAFADSLYGNTSLADDLDGLVASRFSRDMRDILAHGASGAYGTGDFDGQQRVLTELAIARFLIEAERGDRGEAAISIASTLIEEGGYDRDVLLALYDEGTAPGLGDTFIDFSDIDEIYLPASDARDFFRNVFPANDEVLPEYKRDEYKALALPQDIENDLPTDAAFNTPVNTPLVIDMDGDGVELLSLNDSSTFFDLNIDGFAEVTGWVSPDDALLALDVDGDGVIDDSTELFGDQTGFANGFLALAAHDSNADGVIDSNDAVFADLIVWQDANGDGFSAASEMRSLTDVGITSIDVSAASINETNAGHSVLWRSDVTWSDGSTTNIDDVYFERDTRASVALLDDNFQYHDDALKLPALFGYGQIASTWVALSEDATLRTDAEVLLDKVAVGDFTGFYVSFEAFILKWAGVEGVDPTSRGPNIDARHLEFLEKAYGADYIQEPHGWTDPGLVAGDLLTEQFNELKAKLAGRFIAQAAISDALLSSTNEAEFGTAYASHITTELSSLIEDYSPSSRSLVGDIAPAFNSIVASVQGGATTAQDAMLLFELLSHDIGPDPVSFAASVSALAALDGSAEASSIAMGLEATLQGLKVVLGGSGNDTLANSEISIFIGGGGDDTLLGGAEANTYFYRAGDGNDVITDLQGSFERTDRLLFVDLNAGDVAFDHSVAHDLLITTNDGSVITVTGHFDYGPFTTSNYEIEQIEFADGVALDFDGIRQKSIDDQRATGSVTGTKLEDLYRHALGDGTYTIADPGHDLLHDSLTFIDAVAADVSFAKNVTNDLQITLANGETITVLDQFDKDFSTLTYQHELETVVFSDGFTLDVQGIREKSLADQRSTGYVLGTEVGEHYYHALGDGTYSVSDYSASGSGQIDRLTFSDQLASDVGFFKTPEDDLRIELANGEAITIIDHFYYNTFVGSPYQFEEIVFSDGMALDIAGIAAKVAETDQYAADKAAGAVVGQSTNDTYLHWLGDGTYTITDFSYNNNFLDRLILEDQLASEVTFEALANDNLTITFSNGEVVTIIDQFRSNRDYEIERLEFGDGVELDGQGIRNKAANDQVATGAVTGTYFAEHYEYALSDGSVSITDYSTSNTVQDRLVFTDQNASDVLFETLANDDLIITLSDADTITIVDHFRSNRDYEIEDIEFADGAILSWGAIRNKAAADQMPTGVVRGSYFDEVYEYALGDGSIVITDFSYNNNYKDRFVFEDQNLADIVFQAQSNNDLLMTFTNSDTVTVVDQFRSNRDYEIEEFEFADGTVMTSAQLWATL